MASAIWAVVIVVAVGGAVLGLAAGIWGSTPAGNTALVVPFAGGPALIAAGWGVLALALRHGVAGRRRLLAGGAAEGAAALLLSLGAVYAPAILSAPDPALTPGMSLLVLVVPLLLAVPIGVALSARLVRASGAAPWVAGAIVASLVIVASLLPLGLGFVLVPSLIPAVLVAPLVVDSGRRSGENAARGAGKVGWLVAAALVVPLIAVAGLTVGLQAAGAFI